MRLSLLSLLVLLFSCSSNGQQSTSADPSSFSKMAASGKVQVLDVRTTDEFKSGHLKGALHADWLDKNEFNRRTGYLDKAKPVYIYCLSGGRSAAAADQLRSQGYQVTNMEGGIRAWNAAGLPLEGVNPNIKQTSLASYNGQIRSTPVVLVDFGAEWCPPCVKMEPVLQSFMKENSNKLILLKMDAGLETDLMKALNVEALPTFILYKNGQEVKRKQGLVSKDEFNAWLK